MHPLAGIVGLIFYNERRTLFSAGKSPDRKKFTLVDKAARGQDRTEHRHKYEGLARIHPG